MAFVGSDGAVRKVRLGQGRGLRIIGRAAQTRRNRLRQVHVDRAEPEDNRGGFLARSPGEPEDATALSAGVGWHVGSHVSGVVNLGKSPNF